MRPDVIKRRFWRIKSVQKSKAFDQTSRQHISPQMLARVQAERCTRGAVSAYCKCDHPTRSSSVSSSDHLSSCLPHARALRCYSVASRANLRYRGASKAGPPVSPYVVADLWHCCAVPCVTPIPSRARKLTTI
jgi:hypothetical protein